MPNKPKSILLRVVLIAAAAVVAVYAVLFWMRPSVPAVRVKAGMATNAVSGSVIVEAEYTMDLKSEVGGRVLSSTMSLDKRVKEGDVLLQLDTTDLRLALDKTKADYAAAQQRVKIGSPLVFQLAAAQDAYSNAQRQYKAGLISESDLRAQKRQLDSIEQQRETEMVNNKQTLENFQNAIEIGERQISKMTIRAPFDGIIAQVYTRAGDLIGGGAAICRLISTSRTVKARISEQDIAGIRVGQKAYVQFLPYDIEQFPATVSKVMSTADPETQRYEVDLNVKIDPAKLLPGITGEVSIILDEHPSKTIIPRRALLGDEVFVVDDGVLSVRKVKVGYLSMTAAEIREGVSPGEWVVVDKFNGLRDGEHVRIAPVNDPRWK
ncbi:macrolide export protein MacA [mine drainage metagenome]|uniref:Macrolide export protein MacA n=1 Tax=mine drainage metagenome TaxID=410659 RepID=A0A1J5SXQ3_9ZZZZ